MCQFLKKKSKSNKQIILCAGTCQDLLNAYECKCDKGFTGVHCETDINECEPDPCVHGTCRDLQVR
jgi:EGF-like domain